MCGLIRTFCVGKARADRSNLARTSWLLPEHHEKWIRFMASVHPQSATALMRVIDNHLSAGARYSHLALSSPGGSVFHGLSIYNFLRGAPIEVTMYNFGSADSIGVVGFCAGRRRLWVPHARFLIHGISTQLQAGGSYDEKGFEELLKVLNSDYRNVAGVISEALAGPQTPSI
jgi:ATP-dependent Clp protease, protease subunit